jgi:hypothetical protein
LPPQEFDEPAADTNIIDDHGRCAEEMRKLRVHLLGLNRVFGDERSDTCRRFSDRRAAPCHEPLDHWTATDRGDGRVGAESSNVDGDRRSPQGVSQGVIMKLSAWKTRALFDRYNIIDHADLARAVEQRFRANGKPTANMPVASTTAAQLSYWQYNPGPVAQLVRAEDS